MRFASALIVLLFVGSRLSAQPEASTLESPILQPALDGTTPEGYRAHVESLRELVHSCWTNASLCDPRAIGDDDRVGEGKDAFQVRWRWLRTLIGDARDPALKDRDTLLAEASARLDEEIAPAAEQGSSFDSARHAADAILATPEFRIVTRESWLDRKIAQFWNWVSRVFNSAYDFGHRSPWLAPLLEWGFIGLTVVGLLVWVLRTMQRQRIAVAHGPEAPIADWQRESANWAERAHAEAGAGNWREAIHCVYWASIVALESRGLWRRDYARTPREYLRLLQGGSPQQVALRSLTRIFERIWYGLRAAAREDYERALALFEDLTRA